MAMPPMMGQQQMNPMLLAALMRAQQGGGTPQGQGIVPPVAGGMPGGIGGPSMPAPMPKQGATPMMPGMTPPTMPGQQPGALQGMMANPQMMGLLSMLMKNGFGGFGGGGVMGGPTATI